MNPLHLSMLASYVKEATGSLLGQAFFWVCNPLSKKENITFGFEHNSVYVGARADIDGDNNVYGWALIARRDGTASIQVRDENGEAVTVDLLKAVRVLQRLVDAETATGTSDVE